MNNGPMIVKFQGTRKDFIGAWIMRLLLTLVAAAILWISKLILAAVMYLVNTLPPMQADVNTLKIDVQKLKEAAVTKRELADATSQVKQELIDQLKKQKMRIASP